MVQWYFCTGSFRLAVAPDRMFWALKPTKRFRFGIIIYSCRIHKPDWSRNIPSCIDRGPLCREHLSLPAEIMGRTTAWNDEVQRTEKTMVRLQWKLSYLIESFRKFLKNQAGNWPWPLGELPARSPQSWWGLDWLCTDVTPESARNSGSWTEVVKT